MQYYAQLSYVLINGNYSHINSHVHILIIDHNIEGVKYRIMV